MMQGMTPVASQILAHLNNAQLDAAESLLEQDRRTAMQSPEWRYCQLEWLARKGRFDEALDLADGLIRDGIESPQLWHTIARLHVSLGRFDLGVQIMTALRPHGLYGDGPIKTKAPLWDGEDPRGKSICLATEGGVGDVVCFSRFTRELSARGARVILATYPELFPLLKTLPGVDALIDRDVTDRTWMDAWLPALSATYALGIGLEHLRGEPFLTVDPVTKNKWQTLVQSPNLKVGLCWQGRKAFCEDHLRSVSGALIAPILERVPGISWYKIQLWEGDNQIEHPNLIDLTRHIGSVTDLAGHISCLDLLISVDSAPAHLGGALGVPTWLLNRFFGWITFSHPSTDGTQKSPWYQSMKIYTQETFGRWERPLAQVEKDLHALLR